ncbi:Hypothetical predicted protein, partial [Pelobates cultripes]
ARTPIYIPDVAPQSSSTKKVPMLPTTTLTLYIWNVHKHKYCLHGLYSPAMPITTLQS